MSTRRAAALTLATLAAAAAEWAPSLAVAAPDTAQALGLRTRFPDLDGVVLSFDDGPHPQGTTAVLAQLERAQAPAIFFLTGTALGRSPSLARTIDAAGHEIGIHGHKHRSRTQLTATAVRADTLRALEAVVAATGSRPRFYRPPHGTLTLSGLRAVRALALEPLLWSRWGKDWQASATPASIAKRATRALRPGDVILLHDSDAHAASDSWRRTEAALPLILNAIQAAGLRPTLPPRAPSRCLPD